jgi:hypothetical protein
LVKPRAGKIGQGRFARDDSNSAVSPTSPSLQAAERIAPRVNLA